jgi:hypothetical protein
MYSGGSPIVDILASVIASTGLGREGNITRVNAQRRGGRKLALRQRKMKAEKKMETDGSNILVLWSLESRKSPQNSTS